MNAKYYTSVYSYSATKEMKAFLQQIELEIMMLSEITQTPKDRQWSTLLMEYKILSWEG